MYHVYRDVWNASFGEDLPCRREAGNTQDRFAVCKEGRTVRHIPRKVIDGYIALFLFGVVGRSAAEIQTVLCRFAAGGLQIRCSLVFEGDANYIKKQISWSCYFESYHEPKVSDVGLQLD